MRACRQRQVRWMRVLIHVQQRFFVLKLGFGGEKRSCSQAARHYRRPESVTASQPAATLRLWRVATAAVETHRPAPSNLLWCSKSVMSRIQLQVQLTRMPEMKGKPVGTLFLYST